MEEKKITLENLDEMMFTNREIMGVISRMLNSCDAYGYSRILDEMEKITGDRDFMETFENHERGK